MRSRFILRARLLSAIFILIAVFFAARLYFLQIAQGESYREEANAQYISAGVAPIERGSVYFTRLDGSLADAAVQQTGWRVSIVPEDIKDPEATLAALSAETNVDGERFLSRIARGGGYSYEVAYQVSDPAAAAIRAKKLPGVGLARDKWRYYPGGDMAAQALGFVGFKGDEKVGVYGLEKYYEDTLARNTSGLYVNPFAEMFANVEAILAENPEERAGNIITTIEPTVETRLEETLDDIMEAYSPRVAGGIVMDPKTGAIRAMSLRPAFDLNTYNLVSDPSIYSNVLVEGRYEMGSIMKPLTVAAGIDAGAITPTSTYVDRGCIEKSGETICNYDKKARNRVSIQEVLNQSLNLGVSHIVDTMGHTVFAEYMHRYGLGEKTGIDLPNEGVGDIRSLDGKSDVDFASAGFGQGIAVSAIGMTRALASLANAGTLPTPHVVSAIRLESGIMRSTVPEPGRHVLKPETATTVSAMLTKVFDDALLGGELKQEHYSIAAKTGTAQIAVPGGGGYYPDRYLHSFFGYFPAHDPKFIVFLFAIEPEGVEFASASLARPFLDVTKFLINYYDIPPDR